jgi:hypothetical protein
VPLVALGLLDDGNVGDGVHRDGLRRKRHRAASVSADERRFVAVSGRLRRNVLSAGRVVGRVAMVIGVRSSGATLEELKRDQGGYSQSILSFVQLGLSVSRVTDKKSS